MARTFPGKLAVKTPCHVGDDALTAEEKGAYCRSCEKVVHDFSALTYVEAAVLVSTAKSEGRKLCGTLFVRDDGAVLLADGYVKPQNLAKRRLPTIVALGAIGLAACSTPPPAAVPELAPPPATNEPIAPAAPPAPIAAAPEPTPIATPPEPEPEPEPAPPPQVAPKPALAHAKAPPPKPNNKKIPAHAFRGDMAL